MSEWDFLWGLSGQELMDAISTGATADDWDYIEEKDKQRKRQLKKSNKARRQKAHSGLKIHEKKKNTVLLIDGENISHNKAESIVNAARSQGTLFESRVYGRQKDSFTRGWTGKARECGIQDIRLFGEPEKDKADKKIQKDARRLVVQNKNVDVVCLATSDSGYIETIEKLRLQGKRVVVIGEKKSSVELRRSCSRFIEV